MSPLPWGWGGGGHIVFSADPVGLGVGVASCPHSISISSHRLEKYLKMKGSLEKSLKTKFVLKSPWKLTIDLEKYLNFTFSCVLDNFKSLSESKVKFLKKIGKFRVKTDEQEFHNLRVRMCWARKQSSNTHRFEWFVLDVWIVSLADWYLAILTTFITEKGQFK